MVTRGLDGVIDDGSEKTYEVYRVLVFLVLSRV